MVMLSPCALLRTAVVFLVAAAPNVFRLHPFGVDAMEQSPMLRVGPIVFGDGTVRIYYGGSSGTHDGVNGKLGCMRDTNHNCAAKVYRFTRLQGM